MNLELEGGGQRILIAEDLEDSRLSLQQMLQLSLELDVDVAEDGKEALEKLIAQPYSLLITDLRMPRMSGIELIEEIRTRNLPVTVIVTTAHGQVNEAVKAMRLGAYDFLTKPADPDYLVLIIKRALNERRLQDEVIRLRESLNAQHAFQNVLSKSNKMLEIFELVSSVAETTSSVLIVGETGTGKEQVAKSIHQACRSRQGPMVAINCAALPETLLESELFGHEKGSFTGATNQRIGKFEQAHGGTLFLDEVGDIPLSMQIKLLRVLQERKIERIGGNKTIDIDVRVIAATHQPLEKLIRENKFREDLFYRLNVIRIEIPPLRDRREDIPILVSHFLQQYSRSKVTPTTISPEAMQVLINADWPGNVRQLENAIERSCVTAKSHEIALADLPIDLTKTEKKPTAFQVDIERPLQEQLAELSARFEARYIRKALRKTHGHVGKAAEITGMSRRSITDKMSQYKIRKEAFKQ